MTLGAMFVSMVLNHACNLERAKLSLCEFVIFCLLEEWEQMRMSCVPKGPAHSPFLRYDQIVLYSLSPTTASVD